MYDHNLEKRLLLRHILQHLIWLLAFALFWLCMSPCLRADDLKPKPSTSMWWVHGSIAAHMMSAAQDGLSSWKQAEGNALYTTQTGPQTGHFYRQGAGRMAGITVGVCAVSDLVAHFRPRWRKYIAAVNLGAAGAHTAVTTSNVVRNPYYR